jgi:hypothetical protein
MPKTIKNILMDAVLKMAVPRQIAAAQTLELSVGMLARAYGAKRRSPQDGRQARRW